MEQPFRVGDSVRVVRIPAHIADPAYPHAVVKNALDRALNMTFRVEDVDDGG